ncbi:MAG: helix-turn-helix domain-containing protein [Proteobacteria bacterium]|nr:helix-turn-helix domain-containing protein [Pseudomonadota bacterium]
MELTFIKERQRAGIEAAKAKGVYKGRKRTIDREAVQRLHRDGVGATEIARRLGIGRASVYKVLRTDVSIKGTPSLFAYMMLVFCTRVAISQTLRSYKSGKSKNNTSAIRTRCFFPSFSTVKLLLVALVTLGRCVSSVKSCQ